MIKLLSILQIKSTAAFWSLAFYYFIFFFSPIAWLIVGVGIMVAFDWITGVSAAWKNKTPIMSGGFYRTFVKFVMYAIGIISTRLLEVLLNDKIDIPFASLLAGFIIVIEYKSVMENISKVVGVDLWEWIKNKFARIEIKK